MSIITASKKEISKLQKRTNKSLADEFWKRSSKGRKSTLLAKELVGRYS